MHKSIKTFLVCICTMIAMNSHSQNIKRAYKFLERLDYIKAFEAFEKILEEDHSNPAANFAMALMYSNDDFSKTDYLAAWKYVEKADDNYNSLNPDDEEILKEYLWAIETRKSSRPVRKKFEIYKEEIENKLIKYLREENNLEYVNRAIDELKGFKHFDNIIHIRNYLEFRRAEGINTLDVFREFIHSYPDAAQVGLAMEKIHELAFNEAKASNTFSALQAYIDKYPDSKWLPEALMLRNKIEFEKAKKANTFEGYDYFLANYPNSVHVPKVKELQKKLVYEQAKQINTLEAYNKFIKMYPEGAQYVDIFNLKTNELGKNYIRLNNDVQSQVVWSKGFDLKEMDDIPADFVKTKTGQLIITGATQQEETPEYHDAWIVLLDNQGKMVWNKTVGQYLEDRPLHLATNARNEIIIAGYTNSSFDSLSGNAWIFKLKENGDKVWNRSLEIPEIRAMDVNSKDEIILGGYSLGDSARHYILYKLTNDGKKFWERKYTSVGTINDIQVIREDNIVVAGNNWIWKLDDEGYILWETFLEPRDSIVSVYAENNQVFLSGKRNHNECLLMQLDMEGNKVWEQSYASEISSCVAKNIIKDTSGYLYFTLNLNGICKIIKTSSTGDIVTEIDFSPEYTNDIPRIKLTDNDKIMTLISAEELGQKNDMIIMGISL